MANFKEELNFIKAFVFDVDGVFTDGKIYLTGEGAQIRNMNVKDGYAIHHAVKKGYKIGIITGGTCESIRYRFESLGVENIYISSHDKIEDYNNFLSKHNLTDKEVLYMGDDIPDYRVMKKVRIATCPNDASPEIKEISDYISDKNGGAGCVRDIVEQTLKTQGAWLGQDAFVW